MASGQYKIAETSETIEIARQVDQNMASRRFKTIKIVEMSETVGVFTPLLSYS